MTTKHSNKSPFLAVAAALAILVIATPALAADSLDHGKGNSASSWDGALDAVEEWLESAFALLAGSNASGDEEECPSDNCAERFPGVDPNGEPSPEVEPDGDPTCPSGECGERFGGVDPNG